MARSSRSLALAGAALALGLALGCEDAAAPLPPLPVQAPFAAPADPLAGGRVESCAVLDDTRCVAGAAERCAVYDPAAGAFVADPDPLFRRVLKYERWYDRYHQPDGQTANRAFTAATPAGTPEEVWGAPAHFAAYTGLGDSAIWSGTALTAFALRYLQTGTAADYARMVTKTRQVLTMFDVTEIEGYLARFHFLVMDPAAPQSDQHVFQYAPPDDPACHPFAAASAPDLPAAYRDGWDDGTTVWRGAPMWCGHPSIDQYSGPLTSLPLVYGLLDDAALKARIARQVTCYLKRLARVEIRHLQQNPDALDAVRAFFANGALKLDPGDMDFTKLDTVVAYVNRRPTAQNQDTFDRSCPDRVQLEPWRVIDAAADSFLIDMLNFTNDMQGGEGPTAIDHIYAVSVRGGDALHLLHLASVAYSMTGEEQYREFLYRELVDKLRAVDVAYTTGALVMPRWCRSFYGDHITFAPAWSFLTLLGDCPLRTDMQRVMDVELWQKELFDLGNAKFDFMYAGTVPEAIAGGGRAAALADGVREVERLGGNGGVFDDPRRSYTRDRQSIVDALPAGNAVLCPTEAERKTCEDGFAIMGLRIPGESITHACTGAAAECPLGDVCAEGMAAQALTPDLRTYEDFLWQRNPFKLGDAFGVEGGEQSPGLDLMEAFWLGRTYGAITAGQGQVLAWQAAGTSCGP
ncbi:MAG TPA: hypothetical protein VGQ83_21610 [Polyangia bacterium]|jgi:hypothetical protein